jgi:hypothetical protein
MSRTAIAAAAAALLIGSTAIASAQTREYPRYWGDSRYYNGPAVTFGLGMGPGYGYGYAPGYYDYAPGSGPGYRCGVEGTCSWNDGW